MRNTLKYVFDKTVYVGWPWGKFSHIISFHNFLSLIILENPLN
jgi:hypothetical protein